MLALAVVAGLGADLQPAGWRLTDASGNDVGSEIDVQVNFHLTARQDVFVSYSHFFAGDFVKRTGPAFGADYAYVQYSLRW